MHAIIFKNLGPPSVLEWSTVPDLVPGPDQLLVRVKAAALNRADLLQRRGKYPPPPGESSILGLEIAGDVSAIGKNVTHYQLGDRVFGLVGGGGYAEYCLIDAHTAMPIPENLTYSEAAAIPEAFLTANEALFNLGGLEMGETVLIHAGGSGIGTAAIQLAKMVGAIVLTTIGSPEKIRKVETLQPAAIFNYKEENFIETVQSYTHDHGVDVLIDFLGGPYFVRNLQILSITGRLISIGSMSGGNAEINLDLVRKKRLQIKGLIMRSRSLKEKRMITERFKEKWLPLIATGELKPVIDSVFAMKDASIAHEYMEKNAHVGKIILEI
ncbi:MAG: hypothetical protein ACD_60C00156G0010 [uncultured bacterium]|nr:MAG: hypothetical protein ACD_60C00156G0010 [uncultured bacterium]